MPAISPNEQFSRWLSDEEDPCDLLAPFPSEHLVVSDSARDVHNAGQSISAELEDPFQPSLAKSTVEDIAAAR